MMRIEEKTLASEPRSTVMNGMARAVRRRSIPFGPGCTIVRSGLSLAISSTSGSRNGPTLGSALAAAGCRQYCDTATTRSPSPSANSVSVMLGEVETIRDGSCAPGSEALRHASRKTSRNIDQNPTLKPATAVRPRFRQPIS
jgi:hypothetical protein